MKMPERDLMQFSDEDIRRVAQAMAHRNLHGARAKSMFRLLYLILTPNARLRYSVEDYTKLIVQLLYVIHTLIQLPLSQDTSEFSAATQRFLDLSGEIERARDGTNEAAE